MQGTQRTQNGCNKLVESLHLGSRSALILAALFAVIIYYMSYKTPSPRHGGYSTPTTNAAEDALLKVADEISSATKMAFANAASELRAFDKKTGNVEVHSKEAQEAIARGIKSVQATLSEKEQDIVRANLCLFCALTWACFQMTKLKDTLAAMSTKVRDKLDL
jgi:hypothetical protein